MSSKDLLLHTTPAMAHNLELESKRLIDVFELLGARDLPSTVLDATAGLWIDTRAFMISLLRRAICPEAVTEEILTKLEKEGWKRSLKHANDVALQFKNNENYQRVIVEFVREWVMQFILPCTTPLYILTIELAIDSLLTRIASDGQEAKVVHT